MSGEVRSHDPEPVDEGKPAEAIRRRHLVEKAGALAAAALGGVALGSSQTEAQLTTPRLQAGPIQTAQGSAPAPILKVKELSQALQHLGSVDRTLNQAAVPIIVADLADYLQPLLDQSGVSKVEILVGGSIGEVYPYGG